MSAVGIELSSILRFGPPGNSRNRAPVESRAHPRAATTKSNSDRTCPRRDLFQHRNPFQSADKTSQGHCRTPLTREARHFTSILPAAYGQTQHIFEERGSQRLIELVPSRGIGAQRLIYEIGNTREFQNFVEPFAGGPAERPSNAALMRTFSAPVRSGWKPEPSSSNAATRPSYFTARGSGDTDPWRCSGACSCRLHCVLRCLSFAHDPMRMRRREARRNVPGGEGRRRCIRRSRRSICPACG